MMRLTTCPQPHPAPKWDGGLTSCPKIQCMAPTSVHRLAPVFVAAKCSTCDRIVYAETDIEAAAMITRHRCDERVLPNGIWPISTVIYWRSIFRRLRCGIIGGLLMKAKGG
jgi:hypothetical protein